MADNTATEPSEDRDAFEHFYRREHDRLLASLLGLVRDRDRAEEIAATAFQIAWEKRAQFRGDASLATWVQAIGRNAARGSWRQERAGRAPRERVDDERHAEPDRLFAKLEQEERRVALREALERLPVKCRQVLIDHYLNGRSVQEIARRQRVPIGTVGSRLFTARRQLREAWNVTAAPKASMKQEARQMAEDALERLAASLEAGHSHVLKAYLAAQARFHRYSYRNAMLIHAQRPGATRVAGYHTWHDLGRSVKRGEKGIMILAPIRAKHPAGAEEQRPQGPDASPRVVGFRTAYVFDIEQTDGRPLPQFATTTGDPKDHTEKLKAIVAQHGIALSYDPSIAPAQGQSLGGRIRLLPDLAPAEEFSVLAHELAHEMLHRSSDRRDLSKVVRETEAEAVAYVVCRGVGLETHTAAADYIALYNGDKKTLADSLARIQDASSRILDDLLPDQRSQDREANLSDHARSTSTSPAVNQGMSREDRPAESSNPRRDDSVVWDR